MIYVPCDYGVINYVSGSTLEISRLTVLDTNSKFTILESSASSFSETGYPKAQYSSKMTELFGEQWKDLALVQANGFGSSPTDRWGVYNYGTSWYPSALRYAPNVANYQAVSSSWHSVILFNSRKYLYDVTEVLMYELNEAGTAYVKMSISIGFTSDVMCSANTRAQFPILYGSFTTWDALKTATYGFFSQSLQAYETAYIRLSASHSGITSFFHWFFSTILPDEPVVGPSIANCVITVQPYTNSYTGEAITPEVTVISIDPESGTYNYLSEDSDYILTFSNNINPGTASVTITGINNWGGSVTKNFEIVATTKFPITDCSVALNPTVYTYDGTAKRPNVTVTRLDTSTTPPTVITLVQNRDYRLTYRNNVEITNHAAVDITGINSYTGTRTETFRIVSADQDVSNWLVDYDRGPYDYTGIPIEVGYIGVQTPDYSVLVKDEDYTITYYNNTNIGQAYFIIQGIGYYSGSQRCPFYIVGDSQNPYDPGGSSTTGGGDGTFTHSSGTIPITPPATASASNCGMTTIFIPTLSQLRDLAAYLWQDTTPLQTLWNHAKQILENPLDAIISLMVIPLSQSQIGVAGSQEFRVLFIGTGVTMNIAANQFVQVDCGGVTLPEFFGSCLDYSPYTKISLFLPFVGYVDISPDEIMKKRLTVSYKIDIATGAFVAYVMVNGSVYYQYPGNMSTYIPVTAANFSRYFAAFTTMASGAVGAVSGGLVGAAMGTLAGSSTPPQQQTNPTEPFIDALQQTPQLSLPSSGGNIATLSTVANPFPQPKSSPSSPASFAGLTSKPNNNLIAAVMASKRVTGSSGAFSASTAFLGSHSCYLIVTRPRQCLPEDYAHLHGFPCMQTLQLSQLTGYTEVQQCDLVNCPATNPEQGEILELLKAGVIL